MPSITFSSSTMPNEVTLEYVPDGSTTVLDLARLESLPIYWHCGLGTCGTCAARVTVLSGVERGMGNKERNVLIRFDKPAEVRPGDANWRLLCGYLLTGETLRVEW
ncbi:ferredoxin [Chitinivorax tropicus]|uniref:Ferredoxin n=1 Tax=Chitinivorax tropicus TaxID=714531 RepID=A0A840MI13_9PROT|nr:2Fe-2S iron-sulfur cluster-binding protein [Chitinivorax tropicus]MBB5018288.1 ferredoxin [Chitinivorax tropicus]